MTTTTSTISPQAQAFIDVVGKGIGVAAVAWTSEVKPAAAHKAHTLTKRVSATVLTGVEYASLAVNDDRDTGSLPWGTWALAPHIITHHDAEYARLYTVDGTVKTAYFVDGKEVKRDDFNAYLTPSARVAKRPHGGCITVRLSNLVVL